jgi:hypothetical protein
MVSLEINKGRKGWLRVDFIPAIFCCFLLLSAVPYCFYPSSVLQHYRHTDFRRLFKIFPTLFRQIIDALGYQAYSGRIPL